MPLYTYPGVYVQEIPSGVRTVTGVATSIAAFLDFFSAGPMNTPVHISSQADFDRVFGGLDSRSEASYAISQFFLNGGSEAYVVRVAKNTTANPLRAASVTVSDTGGSAGLEFTARNPGVWGDALRLEIDCNTSEPAALFNLRVIRYDGPATNAQPLKAETFLNIALDSARARVAPTVVADESVLVSLGNVPSGMTLPRPNGSLGGDLSQLADFDALRNKSFTMSIFADAAAASPLASKIITLENWEAGSVKELRDLRGQLEKAIRSADPFSPAFSDAAVDLVNNRFRITLGKKAKDYSPSQRVIFADAGGSTTATALKLPAALTDAGVNPQQYQLTGGGDGEKPGAAELAGSRQAEPYTGLYALDHADLFNLLCVPRAADLADTEMDNFIATALAYCEERRAFLLIDVPARACTLEAIQSWVDKYRHPNAAVYFPRLKQPDPLKEFRLRSVGPSGTVAGLYARTDGARGVWKAPAGTDAVLRGISGLDVEITDPENGALNPLAINCFRNFPVYGLVCWGARTLNGSDQAASEWKYVPVRRLALFLEESLFRGTKWVVFEPNDEPLWARIRLNLNAFMNNLFRQGAFQGSVPDQAYYVKCDGETTTQDDRNRGIVNIEVGFAPLKPAEFVVIRFQQIAGKL